MNVIITDEMFDKTEINLKGRKISLDKIIEGYGSLLDSIGALSNPAEIENGYGLGHEDIKNIKAAIDLLKL